MNNILLFKGLKTEIIYNKKLKNTYISITKDKNILIKTSNKSQTYILKLLEKKEQWISKQLKSMEVMRDYQYTIEDEVLLYGQKFSIDTVEATNLRKSLHALKIPSEEKILKCYDRFYKSVCSRHITQRLEYFSALMDVEYNDVKYRKMRSRWGSCSSLKVLTFNSALITIEKKFIDYVVVHELAHLVHMNHSKKFHAFVDKYLENSQEIRKKLKQVRLS